MYLYTTIFNYYSLKYIYHNYKIMANLQVLVR